MFSSNYVRYYLNVYMRFLCFVHSRVNITPSMLSDYVLEWSKKCALSCKRSHSELRFTVASTIIRNLLRFYRTFIGLR